MQEYDIYDFYTPIKGFPQYAIDETGVVVQAESGRTISRATNQQGRVFVNLRDEEGVYKSRSVSLLVAKTFITQPEPHFNSVIHHDYEYDNCHISNLSWRPRWFTVDYHKIGHKYRTQWKYYEFEDERKVFDFETLEVTGTAWQTAMKYGILLNHLLDGIANNTPIFPGGLMFGYWRGD